VVAYRKVGVAFKGHFEQYFVVLKDVDKTRVSTMAPHLIDNKDQGKQHLSVLDYPTKGTVLVLLSLPGVTSALMTRNPAFRQEERKTIAEASLETGPEMDLEWLI
jgi:hypothetical protein